MRCCFITGQDMEQEPAANPADDGPVNLDDVQETEPEQQEAQSPAGGESGEIDELMKEALGEPEANPEFVEVEIDGKTYKVSAADGEPVDPELKFGAMRDADYRKKTMSLSEERTAFQKEQANLRALANLEGDAAARADRLRIIDAQVRQLSQLNVSELQQQGYTDEQIEEARRDLAGLVEQRSNLAGLVSRDIQQLDAKRNELRSGAREEAIRKAGMEDKALTPDRAEYLEKFAVELGFSEEDAKSLSSPQEYKVLHYADIGRKLIERQQKTAAMKAAAAGSPANTLGGAKAGNKRPEDMSMAEYAAWREAGNG